VALIKPRVIIIGAGFTGAAAAHDLALRGFDVQVLERGPIANGTSGRTHGLLHSGGRYAVDDAESARECIEENLLLRKLVPECIEPNGGLFVALNESDLAYAPGFVQGCQACGIPVERLSSSQALGLEPALNPAVLDASHVPDGSFDPLRLALAFAATARHNGAVFHTFCEVEGLLQDGKGGVCGVRFWDRTSGTRSDLGADLVLNATGAWAGKVAAMVGDTHVLVKPTPGVMVAYDSRLTQRVINRLNRPGDGDIIVPQRRMLVVGTTSFEAQDVDYIPVDAEQVKLMHRRGIELVPGLSQAHQRGAYMATRPLLAAGTSGRSLSRTFKCFDHQETGGIGGLVTITGGKATTLRAMAEASADLICRKLGLDVACQTRSYPLLSYRDY
jgi:glycerol-3-phosphate dehydrogenase